MDVTSLYTNIPNHEGIVSVTDMLRENYSKKVSLKSLQKLLKAVLHMNNFEFNGKHYLQIGGTAMGTRVAPSYANIFMGKLEQKLLAEAQKIGLVPLVYLRFIDDLFMVWDLGEAKLKRFIEFSNEFHSTIKFTAEYSREVVNYLDTKVKVKTDHNGTSTIYFDLYTKDTDTHSYLHYTSSHPIHCKKGGPYGEFLRLRRNCTNMCDFEKHAESRVRDYIARGYPEKDLLAAKEKAKAKDRKELLKPKKKQVLTNKEKNKMRPVLVLTYNPANPNMKQILDKHWHLIEKSKFGFLFPEKPLIAYRRAKNISDHLVKAKCNDPHKKRTKTILPPCKDVFRCEYCPRKPKEPNIYISSVTGRSYRGPQKYTCQCRNLIYLISCKKCGKQYVGETYRTFKERMKEHQRYIRNKDTSQTTGCHFNLPGHKSSDFKCQVIYLLPGTPKRNCEKRTDKEEQLMDQLKTRHPKGMNEKARKKTVHH